jgi:hypothetical protein
MLACFADGGQDCLCELCVGAGVGHQARSLDARRMPRRARKRKGRPKAVPASHEVVMAWQPRSSAPASRNARQLLSGFVLVVDCRGAQCGDERLGQHFGCGDTNVGSSLYRPSRHLRDQCLAGTLMIRGSCLCGDVKYEISGSLKGALNCHCSMCRKARGSAFRARARVRAADFSFVCGENLVTFYESSPGNHRGFCSRCGSPIISRYDADRSQFGLPLGPLDDDPGVRPAFHVHTASKAPWFDISDDLPQFPILPG